MKIQYISLIIILSSLVGFISGAFYGQTVCFNQTAEQIDSLSFKKLHYEKLYLDIHKKQDSLSSEIVRLNTVIRNHLNFQKMVMDERRKNK